MHEHKFFSHIKGLRKEVFINSIVMLFIVITYIIAYKISNSSIIAAFFDCAVGITAATIAVVAIAVIPATAIAFASAVVVAAIANECENKYNTTFVKPLLLIISQAIIFGVASLTIQGMLTLVIVYTGIVIYFLFADKRLIAYLRNNPPKVKREVDSLVGDAPYRLIKINSREIPPNSFYVKFYTFFMPKEVF